MQTLYLPDIIHIDFLDHNGRQLKQDRILVGIKTNATHKNDISISPFLTNNNGRITITKQQVLEIADVFISYGIMDYVALEYARPEIQIYLWGNRSLNAYINYWTSVLEEKKNRKPTALEAKLLKHLEEKSAETTKREIRDLEIFSSCFNRTTKQNDDIVLINDTWDAPAIEKNYKVTLNL